MFANQPASTRARRRLGSEVGSQHHRCSSTSRQGSWPWSRGQLKQAGRVWLRGETHLSTRHRSLLRHGWWSQTCIVKKHGERPRPDLSDHHGADPGCDGEGRCWVNERLTGVNSILTEGEEERFTLTHSDQTHAVMCLSMFALYLLKMSEAFSSPTEAEVSLHSHVTDVRAIW